jgi:hypothetical protein
MTKGWDLGWCTWSRIETLGLILISWWRSTAQWSKQVWVKCLKLNVWSAYSREFAPSVCGLSDSLCVIYVIQNKVNSRPFQTVCCWLFVWHISAMFASWASCKDIVTRTSSFPSTCCYLPQMCSSAGHCCGVKVALRTFICRRGLLPICKWISLWPLGFLIFIYYYFGIGSLSWFERPINIWWSVERMKPFVMQFSPFRYFLSSAY